MYILKYLKMRKMQKKKKIDIKSFIIGWLRYKPYYSKWRLVRALLPEYIREQIDLHIDYMNPKCYWDGQCKECGCATTALQMCNKSCEGNCYPPIMTKGQWHSFKLGNPVTCSDGTNWMKIGNKLQCIDLKGNISLKTISDKTYVEQD